MAHKRLFALTQPTAPLFISPVQKSTFCSSVKSQTLLCWMFITCCHDVFTHKMKQKNVSVCSVTEGYSFASCKLDIFIFPSNATTQDCLWSFVMYYCRYCAGKLLCLPWDFDWGSSSCLTLSRLISVMFPGERAHVDRGVGNYLWKPHQGQICPCIIYI